ncbi:MAG: hypothetical protein AMJ90_07830 [candidate division Zixibacteria bacterium SM23_73_2]|nr:MAG: hypothetical protein AMJ90_07830 [candidate division Zixibacteria bacterium SM23_73_2]
MKIKFTLTMKNLLVEEKLINELVLSWVSDLSQEEVLTLSHRWVSDKNFLSQQMVGLQKVGESSLTIEPLEEVKS